jgi:2,3-dihydroxybenzoate-AMP ligase
MIGSPPGVRAPMRGVVYPPAGILEKYRQSGALTGETLVETLRASFEEHAGRVAVSEGDAVYTYRELDEITDRAGGAYLRLGLRPLDRVLFQVPNSAELLFALVGALKAGLIPVSTLVPHRKLEIGYIGQHVEAKAHVVQGGDPKFDMTGFALDMRAEFPSLVHTIVVGGAGTQPRSPALSFAELIGAEDRDAARAQIAQIERDPYQVVWFQLSGGTTGVPKIIPRFQNEYLATSRAIFAFHGLDESTVTYTGMPFVHNAPAIVCWLPTLLAGGEVAASPTHEIPALLRLFAERKPNWMLVPHVITLRLAEAGAFGGGSFAAAKGFTVMGGALEMAELTGAPAYPIYGMSEGIAMYGRRGDSPEVLAQTVGRPVWPHDDLRILEPDTEDDVPFGDVGELAIAGPCVLHGYYDAPERNAEAFTKSGHYRTGDLMRFRTIGDERYLVFEGRIKDVVDRGAEKINCQEIEIAACGHPKIGAIAVVGMPDPKFGERVCAFVVPRPDAGAVSVAELGAYLETVGLAKFKWPERIEIVADFPMTASNKPSKPALRELIGKILQSEHSEKETS